MTEPKLTDKVRLPRHVVYREFAAQTVVLNLESGRYHGLNESGGRMLRALTGADSVDAALADLSTHWGLPRERLEPDLRAFCADLAERGLVDLSGDNGS